VSMGRGPGMCPTRLGGGRGMMPGTGLIRGGQVTETQRLPKGLVGRVWREIARPYRGRLALLVVAIVGASTLSVLPARLLGAIVDVFTPPVADDAGRALNLLFLALLGVAVGAAVFSLWQRYLAAWIGEQVIFDLGLVRGVVETLGLRQSCEGHRRFPC
jgi:ATP-binding cassette, subfamily B, bacterial